jgi:hypothetical protein
MGLQRDTAFGWLTAAGLLAFLIPDVTGIAVARVITHLGTVRTDACEVQLGVLGIPVVMRGEIRFRFEKTGTVVHVTTSGYRVSDRSGSDKDAEIALKLVVWDNVAGGGPGTNIDLVRAPVDVHQDGKWHELKVTMGRDVGFDIKRARFGARFTFDMSSFERSCWADRVISTY